MSDSEEVILFDEQYLQSRLEVIRQYVAKPIPKQPWDDNSPALVPFHEDDLDLHTSSGRGGGGGIIIGGAKHASNIPLLKSMNVTAVLNCASGGIARLPVTELEECGIQYSFTNCRSDSYTYPILHEKKKVQKRPQKLENHINGTIDSEVEERIICSQHLEVSNELFVEVRRQNSTKKGDEPLGNVLLFCVAGQNRSAALGVATMLLHGKSLEDILKHCANQRPFILENVGFQRQLVELEAIVNKLRDGGSGDATQQELLRDQFKSHWDLIKLATHHEANKRVRMSITEADRKLSSLTGKPISHTHTKSEYDLLKGVTVEIELLIPGLCTMEVRIPHECTIRELKRCLVQHANENLLRHDEQPAKVAKAWAVLAMFGYDDMYDISLEVEAIELKVQLERMKSMFGLNARLKDGEPYITWNERCRFALVIFSVIRIPKVPTSSNSLSSDGNKQQMETDTDDNENNNEEMIDPALSPDQVPWTFVHEERPNAPATLLENTLRTTHLRAWDFVTGESLASDKPIVFSFADNPNDRRAFMSVSRTSGELVSFLPGEGDILGMGENAIVHRVQLSMTEKEGGFSTKEECHWDAAVKRPFSLSKMIVFLQNSSEAGLAKRLRLANLLNSDKRVLYFYGLGLGLSTNTYNENEYKFELMLLAKYEEDFSTYTMRCFMEEYVAVPSTVTDEEKRKSIVKLQSEFSLTSVKVFLVSLLNAFRDLTLMGIQAFDFNHLNNVLVSHDHRSVRLIDIDGNAQGSVDYPSLESLASPMGTPRDSISVPQKPSLNVDLNILLPSVIEQLILGKGRGRSFVSNKRSEIWRAEPDNGKAIIRQILMENFYPSVHEDAEGELRNKVSNHVAKVAEWFYALLKKTPPWSNWTHDIYDAMRCIDHLPIS